MFLSLRVSVLTLSNISAPLAGILAVMRASDGVWVLRFSFRVSF